MSFFSHIGLSVIDKLTGNALDKLGNAIKDGDVKKIVEMFREILDGVEDKLGAASELFEDAIETGKKEMRREVARVRRRIVRETRKELEDLHEEFGEKLMEGMRAKVEEMVEVEVEKRMDRGWWRKQVRWMKKTPRD